MSLEMLLIPAAMAAYAAWQARAERGAAHCQVQTRWRHTGLLVQALHDIEAVDVVQTGESTTAMINGISTAFTRRADGVMSAHFPIGTDVDAAVDIVNRVDSAYTRRVQDAVYRRIQTRVSELGYEVASETVDENETITLVVNVGHP